MRVIIDRFEGNYAICENEELTMLEIEKNKLPESAKEGQVLIINGNNIIIDKVQTATRKKEIEESTKGLWEWGFKKKKMSTFV